MAPAEEKHGAFLKVQLSEKAGLTNEKACLAFSMLRPCHRVL